GEQSSPAVLQRGFAGDHFTRPARVRRGVHDAFHDFPGERWEEAEVHPGPHDPVGLDFYRVHRFPNTAQTVRFRSAAHATSVRSRPSEWCPNRTDSVPRTIAVLDRDRVPLGEVGTGTRTSTVNIDAARSEIGAAAVGDDFGRGEIRAAVAAAERGARTAE